MPSDGENQQPANLARLTGDIKQIIDTIPAFLWGARADGGVEFLSQRGLDYTGLTLEQIRDWNWKFSSILHPDDVQVVLDQWPAIVASGREGEIQARMRRADGEYKWFILRVAPLRDQSGQLLGWFGVDVEIDERKRSEDELRRSQSYLAEAQKLSKTGSFGWKPGTAELVWSAETFCILGYGPETEPTLEIALQRVHPEDLCLVQQTLDHAVQGETDMDFENRLLLPDGSVKYVHVMAHPVRDQSGELEFVGAVSDITAAKLAEEKLRQSEGELRRILDFIPGTVIAIDPQGKPLYANRAFFDYSSAIPEQLASVGFGGRLSHPEDVEQFRAIRKESLARNLPFELEQRMLGKDGNYRWFLFRYSPLNDEHGRPLRWYVTALDIEEKRQTEDRLRNENLALRDEIERTSMFEEIVGSSRTLRYALDMVDRVAKTDSTVLLLGETGTGKELIARAIYKHSSRVDHPFIRVNCAAIPTSLIASELFGHEKGAFTGALERRVGRFESANGGTIFLDEIGELPPETQVTLLRVLQEKEFERVGSNKPIATDVRVLAATNRDLNAAVAAGMFRRDLFYRLNVFPILIPPLRERADDIPMLAEYFIDRYARKVGKKIRGIERRTLELFQSYKWPGNIREFQNVIERAVILCEGETFHVDPSWLIQGLTPAAPSAIPFAARISERERELAQQERDLIETALRESHGRISGPSGAAAKLGIPRQTLEYKIRSLGINKHAFKTVGCP